MTVRMMCPECGQQNPLPDLAAGATFPCPVCGKTLRVPRTSAAPSEDSRSTKGKPASPTKQRAKKSAAASKPAEDSDLWGDVVPEQELLDEEESPFEGRDRPTPTRRPKRRPIPPRVRGQSSEADSDERSSRRTRGLGFDWNHPAVLLAVIAVAGFLGFAWVKENHSDLIPTTAGGWLTALLGAGIVGFFTMAQMACYKDGYSFSVQFKWYAIYVVLCLASLPFIHAGRPAERAKENSIPLDGRITIERHPPPRHQVDIPRGNIRNPAFVREPGKQNGGFGANGFTNPRDDTRPVDPFGNRVAKPADLTPPTINPPPAAPAPEKKFRVDF